MRADDFDEAAFFAAIAASGARALLIGRGALVVLGVPILTADYEFWLAIDDIALFNSRRTSPRRQRAADEWRSEYQS